MHIKTSSLQNVSTSSSDIFHLRFGICLLGIFGLSALLMILTVYTTSTIKSSIQIWLFSFGSVFFFGIMILTNKGLYRYLAKRMSSLASDFVDYGKQGIEFVSEKIRTVFLSSVSVYPVNE